MMLDKDTCARLYLDENKTDAEIGNLYGLSQTTVSRRRAKWGIVTKLKSDRLDLPSDFTPRQKELLLGSMLGDGQLFPTGSSTAAYAEFHSAKQKPYLDWKTEELAPFVVRVSLITHTKGFKGHTLYTHGTSLFRPYYDLFYPEGKGGKTFRLLDPTNITPFSLAVWFMDDGSRTTSYARLSVGPDNLSQRNQLRALKHLGLNGSLVGAESGDATILITGSSYHRFVDLVAPHIHPSMESKLEVQTPRKGGIPPREKLTLETLQPLASRGLSISDMAKITNTSITSVRRHLEKLSLSVCKTSVEYTQQEATQLLDGVTDIPTALQVLTQTPVPIKTLTEEELLHDWGLLRKAPTRVEDNAIVSPSIGGSQLCKTLFPHIWDARYKSQSSARAGWYDSKTLEKAIQFQVRVGDPLTPIRVFRAVCATLRAPSNFRPCYAKALVEEYCPSDGVVLDPCAGYGGRAAGTIAAGRSYVGVDPHPNATDSYQRLKDLVQTPFQFHNAPFEEVVLGDLSADMVLTSPPYFSVERYSDDGDQSWVRYKTWGAWVRGFLKPFVEKSIAHLKPEGVLCVNTKNVKIGRKIYPIADTLIELAEARGWGLKASVKMPLGRLNKKANHELVFVFRR